MKKWLVFALALTTLSACGPRSDGGDTPTPQPASPGAATPATAGSPPPGSPPPGGAGSPGAEPQRPPLTEQERTNATKAKVVGDHQELEIKMTKDGLNPRIVTVQTGMPVEMTIVWEAHEDCLKDFVLPVQGEMPAPKDKKSTVEFTLFSAGEFGFGCQSDPKLSGLLLGEGETIPPDASGPASPAPGSPGPGGPGGPPPSPGGPGGPGGPPPSPGGPGGPPPSPAGSPAGGP